MKVSQCNNTNPNFGMKFSFVKKSPNGDWYKAQKCFFDEVQLAIIRRKAEALKPQNDEFILSLDLPTFKVEKDLQNKYFFNNAYEMEVCLKDENGETMSFDLGEKDVKLSLFDAYINVIGGLSLDEPGSDLSVVLAIASSYRDKPVNSRLAAIGEVGLTGEVRSVSLLNQRLSEAARLGFDECIIPQKSSERVEVPDGLKVYRVKNIMEAIEIAL